MAAIVDGIAADPDTAVVPGEFADVDLGTVVVAVVVEACTDSAALGIAVADVGRVAGNLSVYVPKQPHARLGVAQEGKSGLFHII